MCVCVCARAHVCTLVQRCRARELGGGRPKCDHPGYTLALQYSRCVKSVIHMFYRNFNPPDSSPNYAVPLGDLETDAQVPSTGGMTN